MSSDPTGSAFVAHLVSYPSVTQAISLVKSLPLVNRASDISKPYISAINTKVKPYSDVVLEKAQPTLSRADQLGDKFLTNFDTRFPVIKTVQPSDVISEAKFKVGSAKQRVETSASAAANSVKSKYSQVYEKNGKAYVEDAESRLAALNNRIQSYIDAYLAAATVKSKEAGEAASTKAKEAETEARSELIRSYQLALEAISRVKPTALIIKDETLSHVQTIYTSQLKDSESTSSTPIYQLSAAVSTGAILGKETLAKVYQYLSGVSASKSVTETPATAPAETEAAPLAVDSPKKTTTDSPAATGTKHSPAHTKDNKGSASRHASGSGSGASHKSKSHGHS